MIKLSSKTLLKLAGIGLVYCFFGCAPKRNSDGNLLTKTATPISQRTSTIDLTEYGMPAKKSPNRPGRILIVGDIHGQFEALKVLINKINPVNSAKDEVYFLGDLIDRGPDSRKVVALVRKYGWTVLKGNHEDMAVKASGSQNVMKQTQWLKNHAPSTIASYRIRSQRFSTFFKILEEAIRNNLEKNNRYNVSDTGIKRFNQLADDIRWMHSLPLYHHFSDLNVVLVHAGVKAGTSMQNQNPFDLIWDRTMFDSEYPLEDNFVIVGHTVTHNNFKGCNAGDITLGKGWMAIDTGSYSKVGYISAVDILNHEVYQVKVATNEFRKLDLAKAICIYSGRKPKNKSTNLPLAPPPQP